VPRFIASGSLFLHGLTLRFKARTRAARGRAIVGDSRRRRAARATMSIALPRAIARDARARRARASSRTARTRGRRGDATRVPRASNSSRGIDPGVVAPALERRGDECEVADDVLRVVVTNDDARAAANGRSAIKLRSRSIPGLLRSVAWVLHGLDIAAHECAIATDASGVVEMTFECTERAGSSGTREQQIADCDLTRDRLYDYLARCADGDAERNEELLEEDGVVVDNTRNEDSTYVSVRVDEAVSSVISLYPIGNTFTGSGLVVKNGTLTKGVDASTGRATKTWEFDVVRQTDRKKLNTDQLQPLMYTLALVCAPGSFGRSHAFTSR